MRKIKSIAALMIFSICFGNVFITAIRTDYGDSVRVNIYHLNGELKSTGLKIKSFKEGKWTYFDNEGYLLKVERYKNGKKIKSFAIGDLK
jgi:hypothetical protein